MENSASDKGGMNERFLRNYLKRRIGRRRGDRAAAWLKSELPLVVKFGQRVDACPVCSTVTLTTRSWPVTFSCRCGAVVVLDRWLPDHQERALITFPVNL